MSHISIEFSILLENRSKVTEDVRSLNHFAIQSDRPSLAASNPTELALQILRLASAQSKTTSFQSIDVSDFLTGLRPAGSINISNILTGKCLAKIKASNSLPIDKCTCSATCGGQNCNPRKCTKASRIKRTVSEALEDITALFYDEDRNEIYTGNRHGLVHVWSN